MSQDPLKNKLKAFFARYRRPAPSTKQRLKAEAMASFRATQNRRTLHQWVFWRRTSLALVFMMCVATIGLFTSSFTPNRVKAGKIVSTYGPVEIIRGEDSFLVQDETDIFVGDLVRVGNRGFAKLDLTDQGVSTINEKTFLRVTDTDALFIEKGRLASESFRGVEVATDRGLVRTVPGAKVLFEVSETGETKIVPEKNLVQVFDLQDGQTFLTEGQELTLSSDTQLSARPMPTNAALSEAQLEALRSKLAIARSKLLGAIEAQLAGQINESQEEFLSAENTFKSLTQVLLTSRQLEIAQRKNLAEVTIDEVYSKISQRISNSLILDEVEGLAQALDYFKGQDRHLAFRLTPSGDQNLDRYVILRRLAETESGATQMAFDLLAQKYIVNFLQPIQNEPDLTDQLAVLESKVANLPDNADAYYFLRHVSQKMSPTLSTALDAQMAEHF